MTETGRHGAGLKRPLQIRRKVIHDDGGDLDGRKVYNLPKGAIATYTPLRELLAPVIHSRYFMVKRAIPMVLTAEQMEEHSHDAKILSLQDIETTLNHNHPLDGSIRPVTQAHLRSVMDGTVSAKMQAHCDDIFKRMLKLLQVDESTERKARELYRQQVDIYQDDPSAYKVILERAKPDSAVVR